jgi:predicted aldo/keto reductase-like oxidoreductase
MMIEKRRLGGTGIEVSRIGISSSFGADVSVFDYAFEQGCTYFTWGTFIKGRSSPFKGFVRQVTRSGKRAELIIGLLSYSHSGMLGNHFLKSALSQLETDYIDTLILGYYPRRPPQRVLDWALQAKAAGLVRAIGLTTHNRAMVIPLASEGIIDFFHIRYNAVHRGAETEIFSHLNNLGKKRPGIVSFTATSWGQLLKQNKMKPGMQAASAGDCYRFVLARDEVDVCMMGVKNRAMLEANLAALAKGAMSPEELAWMRSIGDHLYGS